MPAKRELTMRQIRQMLRLARDGVSAREIGRTLGVARSTIQDNLKRASTAGLAWPSAGDLTDVVLEQRLFAHAGVKRGFRRRVEPDWGSLACELKRPGVNLMVLWEEYRAVHLGGYGYSRFCDLFREFERRLSPTLASHYGVGILPARPRKPRDKAKVEAGVRFAQTYILGSMRCLVSVTRSASRRSPRSSRCILENGFAQFRQ